MVGELPDVCVIESAGECTATIQFDPDALVLDVEFHYSESPIVPGTFVDRVLGISPPEHRFVIGDVDILTDAWNRIRSISFRTQPASWTRASLAPIPDGPLPAILGLDADPYDDKNRVATVDVPVSVLYDASAHQLAIRFGAIRSPSTWYQVTGNICIGSVGSKLRELRLIGVEFAVP